MGAEMPGDSISVIMVVMKELLFPLLCSFRKFWGRTAGKVMSDWSAGCNSKGPAVSRFSERKMPSRVDRFSWACVCGDLKLTDCERNGLYISSVYKESDNFLGRDTWWFTFILKLRQNA